MSLLCGFMIPLLRISCADELLSQLEVEDDLEKLKELWGAQGVLLQPLWRGGEREAGPWEAHQSMADALCGDLPAQSWVCAEDSTRQLLDACPSWSLLPSICSGAAWENQDPCPRTNALGQPSSWDAAGRRTAAVWWCGLSRLIRGSRCAPCSCYSSAAKACEFPTCKGPATKTTQSCLYASPASCLKHIHKTSANSCNGSMSKLRALQCVNLAFAVESKQLKNHAPFKHKKSWKHRRILEGVWKKICAGPPIENDGVWAFTTDAVRNPLVG